METNLIDHTFNWALQLLDKLIVSPQHSLNYPRLHGLRSQAQIVAIQRSRLSQDLGHRLLLPSQLVIHKENILFQTGKGAHGS